MSPGLAARTALVCVLVLVGGVSRADRRPVAVVDLSGDPEAQRLANQIRGELTNHVDLAPVAFTLDETALVESIVDEDRAALEDAARASREAEAQLAQAQFGNAVSIARAGQQRLLLVTPSATVGLYAELTLTLALALVAEPNDTSAPTAFALVHRLAPTRTLDPARYLPEVVDAFEAAKRLDGVGTIEVKGVGEAFLDGLPVGAAPRAIEAPVGMHYVQLASPERATRGVVVTVVKDGKVPADIDDAPASRALRVRRARAVLGLANDAVSRASAMQFLAKLVGVGDAMLILGPTGKLRVQTWRDVAGFTSAKEVGEQKPLDLLTPLAPPRPKPPKIIPIPIIPIEQPRWYEDRRVQVGTAAAVVIAVLVSILWVRSSVDFKTPNDMIGVQ